MKCTIALTVLFMAAGAPVLAAGSPEQLVQALTQAARQGDVDGFLASMSTGTQKALTDAAATQTKLQEAQRSFQAALDERFGKSNRVKPPAPPDRKSVLAKFVNLELLGAEPKGPNETRLRLKTSSKDLRGRVRTEENSFTAVKENGEWKLEWAEMAQGASHAAAGRAAAYERVTGQIRAAISKTARRP